MKCVTLALVATALSPYAFADGPKDLTGNWESACNAWGAEASCTLSWQEGLMPDLLEVSYRISDLDTGRTIFAGQGVYRIGAETHDGYWSDSSGAIHPLSAKWSNGSLVSHWGENGGAQGRTHYVLTETGMQVTDWALTSEGWQQFMKADYQRAD